MESNSFDFTAIFNIVKNNFKLFAIVSIVAVGLSVFFSGPTFLKPKFKSSAVVYPVNIAIYSEESKTEQLLQMFEASAIRDSIIEKFNLYERFEIEPNVPSSKYYMYLEYNERVISSKTSYESVVLEVLDENPDTAKMMADEVLVQLTNQIQSYYHARGQSRSRAFKRQMDYQLAVIDSIEMKISKLSEENNLVQFESQSRELVRGYVDAISKGENSRESKVLKEWLEKIEKSGSVYQSLQNISAEATKEYGNLTERFLDWRAMGYEEVHYFDVVVSPEVADKKMWPVRWLIVLLSLVSTCFLTLVILAIGKRS